MFGLNGLKEKMEEAQRKAADAKTRLDSVHVEGNSGSYVKVISTANSRIIQVIVSEEAKDFGADELSRHMLVATNNALENAKSIFEAEMSALAREAMPNIPGMPNMGGMFNK